MTPKKNSSRHPSQPDAERFRLLVSSIADYAIFMLDAKGHVTSWNPGAEKLSGYSADEIIGSHFSRLYTPEGLEAGSPQKDLDLSAREGSADLEGWRIRKDGSRYWASVHLTPLRNEVGQVTGFAQIARDLTARHAESEALRISEERFRSLLEDVRDYAIFTLDPQGIVTSWNAGARHIKGYEAHQIIGTHFSRFYPREAVERRWPEHELAVARLDGRFEDEGWRVRADGSRFWANVVITAARDSRGALVGFSKITRDLTERRRHEESLRQSEERLRLLIDGVQDYAIFMLDASGMVSSWNRGAQRIMGYPAPEIIGKHYSHLHRAEDVTSNRPWRELANAREHGREEVESWRVRKDGSVFWASSVITALREDTDEGVKGFAAVVRDLTLRQHTERLEDSARRMQEFVAMLAHELRNPLAPIRNAVSLMAKKGMGDATLEAMRQTIDRQSLHLARILDELLDVNRIAVGRFTIERQQVDFKEVVARSLEASKPLIDARGHALHTQVPNAHLEVQGDAVRLTQTIVNLLNNAAKYTKPGGRIDLLVSVRGGDIEVVVRDTGKGIAPDMLGRIFELFMQIDPAENGQQGGLGVGLALVKHVVELHGGQVTAHSEGLGRGAEFRVTLPLAVHHPRPIEELTGEPVSEESAVLRVLVVDDNADAADSLAMLLRIMGHDTRTAYDGPQALEVAGEFLPDLVFLDIGMPHMNGYEVAQRLLETCTDPPVLAALTGWGQEADRQRAREAGFHRHLVKPAAEEQLRSLLQEVAETRRPQH
jgi:PAS domain S-box-containing protein